MFSEMVMVAGQQVPRFQHLGSEGKIGPASITNLFNDLPPQLPRELVQTLISAANVRIERMSPTVKLHQTAFGTTRISTNRVVILRGAARLRFEDAPSR